MIIIIAAVTAEAPPIPCHVHAGEVSGGTCVGHGKTEAYFFPPLDVPPYNLHLDKVKTRLGLRPEVTREQVRLEVTREQVRLEVTRAPSFEYHYRQLRCWHLSARALSLKFIDP